MSNGSQEFKSVEDCELFTFPFKKQDFSHYALKTIKQGEVIDLLSSNEFSGLDYDSYFRTFRANKSIFEGKGDDFASGA